MPQPTTLATVCRRLTHLILPGLCLVSLAACAAITSLYQGPKITTIIAPQQKTLPGTSLGVFDFSYAHPGIGSTLARAAHEQLLQNRFMHLIERPGISCKTDAAAIAAGRQRGYDVIMQTTILRYSDGGLSTPSSVSLSLKMIDVRSRVTLWYLTGTLEAEPQEVADYIVLLKESRPAEPPTTLSRILLKKMLNKITK